MFRYPIWRSAGNSSLILFSYKHYLNWKKSHFFDNFSLDTSAMLAVSMNFFFTLTE